MNLQFDTFAGFLAIVINFSSFLYCIFVSFISPFYLFFLFSQSIFVLCERYLIKNINAKLVFADRVYDTNEILSYLNQRNISPVIPPKRNRLHQCDYKGFTEKRQQSHRKLYCSHHIIENTFLALKRWRGIFTRYAKTLDTFIASVFIRCIFCYFNSFFSLLFFVQTLPSKKIQKMAHSLYKIQQIVQKRYNCQSYCFFL